MTVFYDLATPPGFRYRAVVNSHGWGSLAPFQFDDATQTLERIHRLNDGRVTWFSVQPGESPQSIRVGVEREADAAEVSAVVARILSVDHDLMAFYTLVRTHEAYGWIETTGAGRMLVSPTVWEDLAKTLLTTNTTWRQTKEMVKRLVTLGDAHECGGHESGARTFPTPEQVVALPLDVFAEQVRAGYRSAYLYELAESIASGAFYPEALRDPALSSDEVYRRLKAIKGFGDYAAGATMRLLGRFDQLGLDSECRSMYARRFNGGNPATDREITAYYAPFGEWAGLVVWMDVMRDWLVTE